MSKAEELLEEFLTKAVPSQETSKKQDEEYYEALAALRIAIQMGNNLQSIAEKEG